MILYFCERSDCVQYEIKGEPFPVVICKLSDGEQMITEKGSMVWMSPNMKMDTKGGGLGKMFSKPVFRRSTRKIPSFSSF